MKTVEVIRIADIPAKVIWDEMKHFDRVLRWVPGGNESTISVKGKGVGAIRDIELVTQGYVQHELVAYSCLLYTSPSPRDRTRSRMPSSA